MKRCLFIVLWSICFLALAGNSGAGILYVKPDGSDSNDGQSWLTPFRTIQKAVDSASDDPAAPDEIWVAAGTHPLVETYAHGDYILVDRVVGIYGGFNGTETGRDQRDWVNNVTIIEGQGSARCFYVAADAIIDGFTITGGNATGAENMGGGIYNDSCAPTIANCILSENVAIYGGGIANISSNPTITSCSFSENSATGETGEGGGMWNDNSSPTIIKCTFTNNSAYRGGGVGNLSSSPAFTDCTFVENTGDEGGGIATHDSSLTITACIFSENSAKDGGGIYASLSSPIIINCSFLENSATSLGGGIYNRFTSVLHSTTITNCTFWSNSANYGGAMYGAFCALCTVGLTNCVLWGDEAPPTHGPEIYTQLGSATVSYCDIDQDGYAGSDGNIREDPRLLDPANGDLHLQLDSPCIDAGTNDAPEIPETDFEGDPRIIDGNDDGTETVDIGADEFTRLLEVETADIRICPKILKLKSKRKAILGLIRLPEEYDVRDIEEDSLGLSIPSCPDCEAINVACGFSWHRRYLAFFARKDLIEQIEDMDLELPTKLELKLSGNLKDGIPFEGLDTIWVTTKWWRKWIKGK